MIKYGCLFSYRTKMCWTFTPVTDLIKDGVASLTSTCFILKECLKEGLANRKNKVNVVIHEPQDVPATDDIDLDEGRKRNLQKRY